MEHQQGSSIPPQVLQAYRETEYRVGGDAPFTLRIGQASTPLLRAQQEHGSTCSAFVSAWNPHSQLHSDEDNAARHQRLCQVLAERGHRFLPGAGQHPSNDWPAETSVLVFGLPLPQARALGQEFAQNAIVWNGADGVPQLVLLR